MKTISIITTVLVLTVIAAPRVRAEETTKFAAAEQFIAEKLDGVQELSADQKTKVSGIFREKMAALQKVARQFADEQRALLEALGPVTVDEKAIRAQAAKVGDVLVEYVKLRAQMVQSLQGVLTSDQQANASDASTKIARFVDGVAKHLAKE